MQPDLALCQRAGLVRAEDVHAAEVLDRGEAAARSPAPAAIPPGPVGQIDADDGREQLRGQADGDR